MMKKIDITNEITELFEEELFQKICIRGELPVEPNEDLVDDIFNTFKAQIVVHDNSVVPVDFSTRAVANDDFLMPFELKAAGAKNDPTLWYNTTTSVQEMYNITLSLFEGTDGEVEIQVEAYKGKEAELQAYLKPFENKEVAVSLYCDGEVILTGEIYVHPEGQRAAGEGQVLRFERPDGDLQFKVDK